MKTFPVFNETVFEYAFRVTVFFRVGRVEVELVFLASGAIDLYILGEDGCTEGARMSGLSLPAKPILVLREPTSMISGIPYMWLKPCGMYIDSYKEHSIVLSTLPLHLNRLSSGAQIHHPNFTINSTIINNTMIYPFLFLLICPLYAFQLDHHNYFYLNSSYSKNTISWTICFRLSTPT